MMKAIVHAGEGGLKGLNYKEIMDKRPGIGEVKVRLKAAGLNHRDLFIMDDRTKQDTPLIIGSDGAGRIEAIGEGVLDHNVGEDVIINPCIGWEYADNVPNVPAIVGDLQRVHSLSQSSFQRKMPSASQLTCHGKKPACCPYQP